MAERPLKENELGMRIWAPARALRVFARFPGFHRRRKLLMRCIKLFPDEVSRISTTQFEKPRILRRHTYFGEQSNTVGPQISNRTQNRFKNEAASKDAPPTKNPSISGIAPRA